MSNGRRFKRLDPFVAVAPKLATNGGIEYCLWVDDNGALYVQMLRNLTSTKKPGTLSKLLFRVSDLLRILHSAPPQSGGFAGFNADTFSEEISSDNDNVGFLKAILNHLLPQG